MCKSVLFPSSSSQFLFAFFVFSLFSSPPFSLSNHAIKWLPGHPPPHRRNRPRAAAPRAVHRGRPPFGELADDDDDA